MLQLQWRGIVDAVRHRATFHHVHTGVPVQAVCTGNAIQREPLFQIAGDLEMGACDLAAGRQAECQRLGGDSAAGKFQRVFGVERIEAVAQQVILQVQRGNVQARGGVAFEGDGQEEISRQSGWRRGGFFPPGKKSRRAAWPPCGEGRKK